MLVYLRSKLISFVEVSYATRYSGVAARVGVTLIGIKTGSVDGVKLSSVVKEDMGAVVSRERSCEWFSCMKETYTTFASRRLNKDRAEFLKIGIDRFRSFLSSFS